MSSAIKEEDPIVATKKKFLFSIDVE